MFSVLSHKLRNNDLEITQIDGTVIIRFSGASSTDRFSFFLLVFF